MLCMLSTLDAPGIMSQENTSSSKDSRTLRMFNVLTQGSCIIETA